MSHATHDPSSEGLSTHEPAQDSTDPAASPAAANPTAPMDAEIFCQDRRLARLLEWELAAMGFTSQVKLPSSLPNRTSTAAKHFQSKGIRLLLVDLDAVPPDRVAILPAGFAMVAWSYHADRLPAGCPPSSGAVFVDHDAPALRIFLRRPFSLASLEQAVKTCLGYQPVSALFTLLAANRPVQKEGRYGSLIDREKAIVLRPSVRAVVLGGSDTVFLTPGEWKVFFCLWENRGKVVSRETLRSLFGPRHSNLVDSYISFLREKLEKPRNQRLIITIRGEGYTIRNDAELEK